MKQKVMMKKSAVNHLRDALLKESDKFHRDSVLQIFSTSKTDKWEQGKYREHPNLLVYVLNGLPFFFDLTCHGRLCATLFSLSAYPELLPRWVFNAEAITEKLAAGTPLFAPGMVKQQCALAVPAGAPVALCDPKGRLVAVATADCSGEALQTQESGKCVDVIHCVGDLLWQATGRVEPVVVALGGAGAGGGGGDGGDGENDANDANDGDGDNGNVKDKDSDNDKDKDEGEGEVEVDVMVQSTMPLANDEDFERIFLLALHLVLLAQEKGDAGEKEQFALPLDSGLFFARFMQPVSDVQGLRLMWKRTSFKKMGRFLQAMEKKRVIKARNLHDGSQVITRIDAQSALLERCEMPASLPKAVAKIMRARREEEAAAHGGAAGSSVAEELGLDDSLQVLQLYRIVKDWEFLIPVSKAEAAAAAKKKKKKGQAKGGEQEKEEEPERENPAQEEKEEKEKEKEQEKEEEEEEEVPLPEAGAHDKRNRPLYSGDVVRGLLFGYLARKGLDAPGERSKEVALDDALRAALKAKDAQTMEKKVLIERMFAAQTAYYVLRRGPITHVQVELPQLKLRVDRRGGNKLITRVEGVRQFAVEPERMAHLLSKKFACSCSCDDEEAGSLVMQGDRVTAVQGFCKAELGIPEKMIEIVAQKTKKGGKGGGAPGKKK